MRILSTQENKWEKTKKYKEHHREILEYKLMENLKCFSICHLKSKKNHTNFELLNIDCQPRTPCPVKLSINYTR